ncbi:MAG TPA: hypothetical protein VHO02_04815, partial [Fibrobacteria bacterium]|nr:hypothetical protein [Fibrobacteria bacterium]
RGANRFGRAFVVFNFSFLISHFSFSSPLPAFSHLDSLFLIAATGEPRFAVQRDSCEKVLTSRGAETLDYLTKLAARPDRSLTPRQRQYIERLFTIVADSGRNPVSRDALARAIAAAPGDTLRARWLYVGSRMGDTAFRAVALPWLKSESGLTRRAAARALGAYPRAENVPLLLDGIDTLRGADRYARLWALGEQAPLRDWKPLLPLLEDENAFNRRKVRDLLLRATDSSWTKLRTAIPKKTEQPGGRSVPPLPRHEWLLLALDAKGGREFLNAESGKMSAEEKRFFGVAPD